MATRFQPIYDIATLCAQKGLTEAVLCPGSRCAPLTLAFTRHPKINCKTISDERSAAFIALGIAQELKRPGILVSTSGTAAYNFAPAVAEAFFSKRPLIVFTADRPTEWVGQQDGQTIYQADIFGKHVKRSFQLPQEYEHPDNVWAINRMVNEAINLSQQEPKGPVHINVPFREPLYPANGEAISFSDQVRNIEERVAIPLPDESLRNAVSPLWTTSSRVLIVAGQMDWSEEHLESIGVLINKQHIPVVGDVISNLHGIDDVIRHADLFLAGRSHESLNILRPELLITIGESTISKNVKVFLRKNPATIHWHIQIAGDVADVYQSVTHVFRTSVPAFIRLLTSFSLFGDIQAGRKAYTDKWRTEEEHTKKVLKEFIEGTSTGEIRFVEQVIRTLPTSCNLHLANSMSVRYANMIGLSSHQRNVKVFANRGTSGIDGCTSTCVGHALSGKEQNILITGDLAFFYDRNAFWHNYKMPGMHVVVVNNHGGIIFKMIDGPGDAPEADEYFVTRQRLSAKHLSAEFGLQYYAFKDAENSSSTLRDFFEKSENAKIVEYESDQNANKALLDELKSKIKKSYES